MHEALFDGAFLKGTGVGTLSIRKAMIDEGYHPMTMYFRSCRARRHADRADEIGIQASLDLFIGAMRDLALDAEEQNKQRFTGAPYFAPRKRLDETRAARAPILRWKPPQPLSDAQAAE